MSPNIPTVKLSNEVEFPLFGLGTWLSTDPEPFKSSLRTALDSGYRYIDTAYVYKNEHLIGEVLQEYLEAGKFKRSDIFLTTKLPLYGHHNPETYLRQSLKNLRTDFVDLYLIHTPLPGKPNPETNQEWIVDGKLVPDTSIPLAKTWELLENLYEQKLARAIGVSNFNVQQLQEIYDSAKKVKPQNLQVELTIVLQQPELTALCRKLNVSITSYGTLGSPGSKDLRGGTPEGGDCLGHPLVKELSQKYHKSPAQILLRNFTQRGISVIPKSTNANRVKENLDIYDFEISPADLLRLDEVDINIRNFKFEFADTHPWFPFEN